MVLPENKIRNIPRYQWKQCAGVVVVQQVSHSYSKWTQTACINRRTLHRQRGYMQLLCESGSARQNKSPGKTRGEDKKAARQVVCCPCANNQAVSKIHQNAFVSRGEVPFVVKSLSHAA